MGIEINRCRGLPEVASGDEAINRKLYCGSMERISTDGIVKKKHIDDQANRAVPSHARNLIVFTGRKRPL